MYGRNNWGKWDDASDLSSDESVFEDLVRLVAGTSGTSKNDVNVSLIPSGMVVFPVSSHDEFMYSEPMK
jgi:hypothetical protein